MLTYQIKNFSFECRWVETMETTALMESCVAVPDACSVVQGKGMAYRRPLLRLTILMGGKPIVSRLCRRQDQRLIAGTDDEDDDEDDGETVNGPPHDDGETVDGPPHYDTCSRLDDGETSPLLQEEEEKKMKKKKKKTKTKKMKKKTKKTTTTKKKNHTDHQILPKQSVGEIAEKAAAARTVRRLKIIHDGKAYVMGSRPEHPSSNQEDQERSPNKGKQDGTEDCHLQKRKHRFDVDDNEEQPTMKKLQSDRVARGTDQLKGKGKKQ